MDSTLRDDFANPGSEYRAKPFWAWNGKLEPAELRRQIRIMKKMGLGGFFMHSRIGLDTAYLSDEWFECVAVCIDEAKKLGLEAWLYDEDRWPSGAAGGLVTCDPKYRARSVMMAELSSAKDLKWDADTIAAFTATVSGSTATDVRRIARGKRLRNLGNGQRILVFRLMIMPSSSWFNGYAYLDTMSHQAVRKFIAVTHEAYRRRVGKHFGKVVPGIFTDEPYYGIMMDTVPDSEGPTFAGAKHVPWTPALPREFRKRYGYDILDHLPEIFLDVDGEPVTPARHDYHDCVTHLFVDAFSRQVGQWCEKNGLLHTGHVMEEETPWTQMTVVGSCMRFYEHMQTPGIDLLTQYGRGYSTAKQVSSAARQFGRKRRLTETYGCTGWDFPFAGHKAVGDWQTALGINLRCQHLAWYTMEGEAKRDYPASIFYQSPWWDLYPLVEDYFARVHAVMTRGREVRDLLVIHPLESAWVRCRRGVTAAEEDETLRSIRDSLLAANIDFDYGDEDILARHGKVSRKSDAAKLIVGKAPYKAVLVPPMLTMRSSTLRLLKRFKAAGGTVVFAGPAPRYVNARRSEEARRFASDSPKAPTRGEALVGAVQSACRRVSIADSRGRQIAPALHLLREDDKAYYLFVCNVGHDFNKSGAARTKGGALGAPRHGDIAVSNRTAAFDDVRIHGFAGCKGRPIELAPATGEVFSAEAERRGDGWEIRTSLPALGSRIFVIPKRAAGRKVSTSKRLRDVRSQKLNPGRWDIVLSECNNLVLDRLRYRIGSGRWQKAEEILRVDRAVRNALGISARGGEMVQPWAQRRSESPRRIAVALAYAFDVRTLPSGECSLGIEQPARYRITLNGQPVAIEADAGWWVDKSLRRIPMDPSLFRLGRNELLLECDYDEYHPGLEIVYLLGNFGTKVRGTGVTVTATPTSLKLGDWVKQGLAFYSGSVGYRRTIRPKLRAGQRLFVQVPSYRGVAVRILVDGKPAGVIGWEPNEVDITDLVSPGRPAELAIEVIGHRRNSHGPLHMAAKNPFWVGPEQYTTTRKDWIDEHQLVPCGLMEPPRLIVRR